MKLPCASHFAQIVLLAVVLLSTTSTLSAAAPVVSNVRAAPRANTHYVDIYYDVSDADGDSPLTVYVSVSPDGGTTWEVPGEKKAGVWAHSSQRQFI